MRSINNFNDYAPQTSWLVSFFYGGEKFFEENSLSRDQGLKFKAFLRYAGLQEKLRLTEFASTVTDLGWNTDTALGLIFTNLVYSCPQIEWYAENLTVGTVYRKEEVKSMLSERGLKERAVNSVYRAFRRLTETPFGTRFNFGYVEGGTLARTACVVSEPKVILYALYKFAEKRNEYKEFTLNYLLSDNIERGGVSPTRVFGLDREAMIPILLGLAINYPDFIYASFTNNLDKISLRDDKTSEDVLKLFKEDKQ